MKPTNLLPCDGEANYYGPVMTETEAARWLECLRETIEWRRDEVTMFGKRIVTARKVAWYGEKPFAYSYSGTTRAALSWTPELVELKTMVEEVVGASFNSCLLNLYHDGSEGMGWHSDDEETLVENATIGSLSIGATRKFVFRHRNDKTRKVPVLLESGSLLAMRGATQENWSHALMKSKRVVDPRINLTFRRMKA